MLHHVPQIDRIECAVVGDQLRGKFLRQVARMDFMPLAAGNGRGDRIGLDPDHLLVAGTTKRLEESTVVAADVDGPSRILARHRRGDQILEVPRTLKARRVGVRLAIDQVRRNGVGDLQEAAILAASRSRRKIADPDHLASF